MLSPLLVAASLLVLAGPSAAAAAPASAFRTPFTSEQDLVRTFQQLSASGETPEIFLDMDVATTADFLTLASEGAGEGGADATVAQFLDVPAPASSPSSDVFAFTAEGLAGCSAEDSVFGVLERREGTLASYDFGLTTSALESTGLGALLSEKEEDGAFKAYVLAAPTDAAWVKLKQQLLAEPSVTESLPLQSLLTYQIYGEANATLFNAVKDVINGTFFDRAAGGMSLPFAFFVNIPVDMLDGNATVLSTGSSSGAPELNGSPVLAMEPACNGVVVAIDDILVPGSSVEQYMKDPPPTAFDSEAEKAEAEAEAKSKKSQARAAFEEGECVDVAPPAPLGTDWTCQDQMYWGKCAEYWMWANKYCADTCGYCGAETFPYAAAGAGADASPQGSESDASASGAGEAEAEEYVDPCACSPDGLSGDVYTGVAGCNTMTISQLMGMAYASSTSGGSSAATEIGRQFGAEFNIPGTPKFNYCYVVNPSKCKKNTEPSPFYEGVRWKFC